MKIVRWNTDHNGNHAWLSPDGVMGYVLRCKDGSWFASGEHYAYLDPDEFLSDQAACLAVEANFPPVGKPYEGWLETKTGGYFSQYAKGQRIYVRKIDLGWYAVLPDGKVLGKAGDVVWFTTCEEAFAAVEQEMHMPVDADPFRDKSNDWCWIKVKQPARVA